MSTLDPRRPGIGIHGLYALTPDTEDTDALLMQVEDALTGGVGVLQYRNKSPNAGLRLEQAEALLRICRRHGIPLIINDDLALARRLDADGLHLGREDGELSKARSALGREKLLGASCYGDLALAISACEQGADHVAFGSFFASTTKPGAVRVSPALLTSARERLNVPIVAIGGITVDNAGALIAAGATSVAVVSDLFDATDIAARARAFVRLFESRPT
ncbi:MAG: thiamine phosphate synthase [Burkholderiales bacterium]